MVTDDPYAAIQMLVAGLPDTARSIVAKSRELRRDDEIDLALLLLDRATAKSAVPIVVAERADLLASQGRLEEALDLALKAVEADPKNTATRDVLAAVLVGALPASFEHLVMISQLFAEEEEADYAEDLIRRGVEAHPDDVALRMHLAQFYLDRGQSAGAIVELTAALRLAPDNADAEVKLASALVAQRDVPGARRWLDSARAHGAPPESADAVARQIDELA